MAIKIGSISISLTAETSSFTRDMDKASHIAMNSSKNIERSFKLMAGAITAATGSAAAAMSTFIYKTQHMLFNMRKMAEYAGTNIESYSKLAYAAKLAGMPAERLAETMARLAHNYMIAAGGSLEQAAAFKSLGINLHTTNGAMMDTTDLFLKVAKALNKYKDSANKTGVETLIMGRSGAQAQLLMKMLANEFPKITAQAEKLGVVFTKEMIDKSQKLHNSWVQLESAAEGLSARMLSDMSPALHQMSQEIVTFLESTRGKQDLELFGEDMAKGLKLASEAFEVVTEHATLLKDILESYATIRVATFLYPMMTSAAETTGVISKLGIALGNLGGRALGIKSAGKALTKFGKDAKMLAASVQDAAKAEGAAAAAGWGLEYSLESVSGVLKKMQLAFLPLIELLGAYEAITTEVSDAHKLHERDQLSFWKNLTAQIEVATGSLKGFGNTLAAMFANKNGQLFGRGPDYGGMNDVAVAEQARINAGLALGGAPSAPGLPKGYNEKTGTIGGTEPHSKKKNMPGVGITDPNAAIRKNLGLLKEQSRYTQEQIKLLNATPEQKRTAAIMDAFTKWKVKEAPTLKKVSEANRKLYIEQAKAAIAAGINAKATLKYDTDLQELNQTLDESIAKHEAMAAAIGKSAKAMQNAMVAAQVNQKMESTYGQHWKHNPKAVAASIHSAAKIRQNLNAANVQTDRTSVQSLKDEYAKQLRLSSMVGLGSSAMQAAQIQNAQNQIRAEFKRRGDTNVKQLQKELDLTKKIMSLQFAMADKKAALSYDPRYQYQQQLNAINAAVAAAQKLGLSIDYTEVLAADHAALMKFQNSQDQAILKTGTMLQGLHLALNQMARDTVSNAQIMHDALTHAVGSVNSSLSSALVAHAYTRREYMLNIANSLSHAGRGIASNFMHDALAKSESGLLTAFGLGKMKAGKPDGSSQNPWYVRLVNHAHGEMSHLTHPLSHLFKGSHAAKMKHGEDLVGHLFGTAGHTVSHLVGKALGLLPHFAAGGSVIPGMPSIVGERGPELFVPPSAGRIIPNNALHGGAASSPVIHVDARGAHDPAATEAAIHRAFKQYTPHIAAIAVAAQEEHKRRMPTMR